jgi:hypothetical protein
MVTLIEAWPSWNRLERGRPEPARMTRAAAGLVTRRSEKSQALLRESWFAHQALNRLSISRIGF